MILLFCFASDFSSKALTDALIDGPFHKLLQSVAFVKSLNARMEAMCRQSFAGSDAIDIQPVIRSMTFDIIYGELNRAKNSI